jgi:hypothetical protein
MEREKPVGEYFPGRNPIPRTIDFHMLKTADLIVSLPDPKSIADQK